jgi:hypothetical protein
MFVLGLFFLSSYITNDFDFKNLFALLKACGSALNSQLSNTTAPSKS